MIVVVEVGAACGCISVVLWRGVVEDVGYVPVVDVVVVVGNSYEDFVHKVPRGSVASEVSIVVLVSFFGFDTMF